MLVLVISNKIIGSLIGDSIYIYICRRYMFKNDYILNLLCASRSVSIENFKHSEVKVRNCKKKKKRKNARIMWKCVCGIQNILRSVISRLWINFLPMFYFLHFSYIHLIVLLRFNYTQLKIVQILSENSQLIQQRGICNKNGWKTNSFNQLK